MTQFAFNTYTGNGSTTQYSISFSYIDSTHVKCFLDGVSTTAFTISSSTITFNTAPTNNAVIRIERQTPVDSRLVDFQDGSVLTEAELDMSANQNFYAVQEITDDQSNNLALTTADVYDANNKRIINVANPTANNDAVNKTYLENTWLSSANKTALTTVNSNIANINAVNSNSTNINQVATDTTAINTVATNIGSVNTVATDITKVIAVANDLAEAVSEIETVADDLNEASSEIDVVANNITNVNTVGGISANVTTVAGISANVTTVAGNDANVTTVAGISGDVTSVAGISTDVSAVENIKANVTTVAGISSDVTSVAGVSANVSTLAPISANITTVAGISANVTTVAGNNTNINTVAGANSNITAVAGAITNVNNVGGAITNINTVATNLASVNSFANTYLGASGSAPTQDPDGSALDIGDLYFDTSSSSMKVYSSGGWINSGSSVNGTANRFSYTATAGQTTFTGADANGNTLAYDAGYVDIFLNGIKIVVGTDVTATSGTSVVLATGATVNDTLELIAYGTFTLANFSITDANDVPALGSAGKALVVNSGGTALEFANTSSAEVYGFNKNSSGQLIVTTTNQGVDNISSATFATFDDVLFSASGFVFSIDANGDLISTI